MVLGRAAIPCIVALAAAASFGPGPKNNTQCLRFCNGTAPFHPEYSPLNRTNITVYRLTSKSLTEYGIANKNTGDVPGDVGFYIESLMIHVRCKPPWTGKQCFLAKEAVIQQWIIETDGSYGPYSACNPASPTNWSTFNCVEKRCICKRANASVGVDPANHRTQEQCNGSKGVMGCRFGGLWFSTPAEGECKGAARPGSNSGHQSNNSRTCTWRAVAQPKTINETCMRQRMLGPIEANNRPCFDACGPVGGPYNVSSSCYKRREA